MYSRLILLWDAMYTLAIILVAQELFLGLLGGGVGGGGAIVPMATPPLVRLQKCLI